MDVGVVAGRVLDLVVDVPALWVVERHRPDEGELRVGHLLPYEPVGGDHAKGVFPGIEARDLSDERARGVDADPFEHAGREFRAELEVLGALGIDGGRDDLDSLRPGNREGRSLRA